MLISLRMPNITLGGGGRISGVTYLVRVCALAGALLATADVFSENAPGRVLLVGNSPYVRSLGHAQVQQLFAGQLKQWPDKTPVRVFVRNSDTLTHRRFSEEVLQVFPYQLQRAWDRNVFSGSGEAPTVVGSQAAMIEKLTSVPGSVGYIVSTGADDLRGLETKEVLP